MNKISSFLYASFRIFIPLLLIFIFISCEQSKNQKTKISDDLTKSYDSKITRSEREGSPALLNVDEDNIKNHGIQPYTDESITANNSSNVPAGIEENHSYTENEDENNRNHSINDINANDQNEEKNGKKDEREIKDHGSDNSTNQIDDPEPPISYSQLRQLTDCPIPRLSLKNPVITTSVEYTIFVYCVLEIMPEEGYPEINKMDNYHDAFKLIEKARHKYIKNTLHVDPSLTNEEKLALFERLFLVTKFRALSVNEKELAEDAISNWGLAFASEGYINLWFHSDFYSAHLNYKKAPQPDFKSYLVRGKIVDDQGQLIDGVNYQIPAQLGKFYGFQTKGLSETNEIVKDHDNDKNKYKKKNKNKDDDNDHRGDDYHDNLIYNFELQFYESKEIKKNNHHHWHKKKNRKWNEHKKEDIELPIIAEKENFEISLTTHKIKKKNFYNINIILQPKSNEPPDFNSPQWPSGEETNVLAESLSFTPASGNTISNCIIPQFNTSGDTGIYNGILWQDFISCILKIELSSVSNSYDYFPLATKEAAVQLVSLITDTILSNDDNINKSDYQIVSNIYTVLTFKEPTESDKEIINQLLNEFGLNVTINNILVSWYHSSAYATFDYSKNAIFPKSKYTFSGTIKDIEGNLLNIAQIELLSIDGVVLKSTLSVIDGLYKIIYPIDDIRFFGKQIKIKISSPNYAENIQEIKISQEKSINTDIVLLPIGVVSQTHGGQIISSNGGVTINFPANAVADDTQFSVSNIIESTDPELNNANMINFSVSPSYEFIEPVQLKVKIPDSMIDIDPKNKNLIAVIDVGENKLEALENIRFNVKTKTLYATTKHFSNIFIYNTNLLYCRRSTESISVICLKNEPTGIHDTNSTIISSFNNVQIPSKIPLLISEANVQLEELDFSPLSIDEIKEKTLLQGMDFLNSYLEISKPAFENLETPFELSNPEDLGIKWPAEIASNPPVISNISISGSLGINLHAEACNADPKLETPGIRVNSVSSTNVGFNSKFSYSKTRTFDCFTCWKRVWGKCVWWNWHSDACYVNYSATGSVNVNNYNQSFTRAAANSWTPSNASYDPSTPYSQSASTNYSLVNQTDLEDIISAATREINSVLDNLFDYENNDTGFNIVEKLGNKFKDTLDQAGFTDPSFTESTCSPNIQKVQSSIDVDGKTFNEPISVKFSCRENTDCKYLAFTFDGSYPEHFYHLYSADFNFPVNTIPWVVKVRTMNSDYVQDQTVQTFTFFVGDKSPPVTTTSIDLNGKTFYEPIYADFYYQDNEPIKPYYCQGNTCLGMVYTLDGSEPTFYPANGVIRWGIWTGLYFDHRDTPWVLKIRSMDLSGNLEETKTYTFNVIDNTPPVTTLDISEGEVFTYLPIVKKIKCFDLFKCDQISYTLDGSIPDFNGNGTIISDGWYEAGTGLWVTEGYVILNSEGYIKINYRSKDKSGNIENTKTRNFIIDITPPVITTDYDQNAYLKTLPQTINVTCSDNFECRSLNYGIDSSSPVFHDHGTLSPNGGTISINSEGIYTVKIGARDIHNLSTGKTINMTIDFTPPVTSTNIASGTIFNQIPSAVSFTCEDMLRCFIEVSGSGVTASGYSLANLLLTENNIYTVKYFATDDASNIEVEKEVTFIVDNVAPNVTVHNIGHDYLSTTGYSSTTINWQSDKNGIYSIRNGQNCNGTIFAGANATGSITANVPINYTINANDLPIGETGLSTNDISFCVLAANNLSGGRSFIFYRQEGSPVTTVSPESGNYNFIPNLNVICVQNCDKIAYSINQEPDPVFDTNGNLLSGNLYNSPINPPDMKETTYKFIAIDKAGNLESGIKSVKYLVDTNLPVVTINSIDYSTLSVSDNILLATINWQSSRDNLEYKLLINSLDCSSGTSSTGLNNTGSTSLVPISSEITVNDLNEGNNTIRVCVKNLIGDYGMVSFDIRREELSPFVSVIFNEANLLSNATGFESSIVTWQSNQDGLYSIKIGGDCSNGVLSNGLNNSGNIFKNQIIPTTILASDLSEGKNTVVICVTNNYNLNSLTYLNISLDNLQPSTLISPSGGIFGGAINISLICEDNHSCFDMVYTLDGTEPDFSGNGIIIIGNTGIVALGPGDGQYQLNVKSRDSVGLVESTQLKIFKIDSTKPQITIRTIEHDYLSANGFSTGSIVWQSNRDGDYSLKKGDCSGGTLVTGTNVSGPLISNTGIVSTLNATDFELGANDIHICAKDANGNESDYLIRIYRDDTKPESSNQQGEGAYGKVQDILITCADHCYKTAVTVDGTEPTFDEFGSVTNSFEYSSLWSTPSPASTLLKFRSFDKAGNIEDSANENYIVDETLPTINIISNENDVLSNISGHTESKILWNIDRTDLTYTVRIGGDDCLTENVSSKEDGAGNTVNGFYSSTIIASDLVPGNNSIRICSHNLIDKYGYTTYKIKRDDTSPIVNVISNEHDVLSENQYISSVFKWKTSKKGNFEIKKGDNCTDGQLLTGSNSSGKVIENVPVYTIIKMSELTNGIENNIRICSTALNGMKSDYVYKITRDDNAGSTNKVEAYYRNAPQWNDYFKNDSPDIFSASNLACNGNETIGKPVCLHGGEMRSYTLSSLSSCDGITANDELNVFEWVCSDKILPIKIISKGFKEGKSLSDLVDFTLAKFLENRLNVFEGLINIVQTPFDIWWTNTVVINNIGGSVNGNINLVTQDPQKDYQFTGDKTSLIVKPGIILKGDESILSNLVISASFGLKFIWFEGTIDPLNKTIPDGSASSARAVGIRLENIDFARIQKVKIQNSTRKWDATNIYLKNVNNSYLKDIKVALGWGSIDLDQSSDNYLKDIRIAENSQGLTLSNSSNNNIIENVTSTNQGNSAFAMYDSTGNIVRNGVFTNSYNGIFIGASPDNVFQNITTGNTFKPSTIGQNVTNNIIIGSDNLIFLNFITLNSYEDGIMISSSHSIFENMASGLNELHNFTINGVNNKFTGNLIADNYISLIYGIVDCASTDGTPQAGMDNNCNPVGDLSDYGAPTFVSNLEISFVGKKFTVNDDEHYAYLLDDLMLGNRFSHIGPDGDAFPDVSNSWFCSDFICAVWDWTAMNHINWVNPIPTGDNYLTHRFTNRPPTEPDLIYLRNAVEVLGDGFGNENGLCEMDETCLVTRNIGAFQGFGIIGPVGGAFVNGTINNVKLMEYKNAY